MSQNVSSLFQSAHDDGALSGQALQALTVVDLGAQIQAGLGINVDDVKASEVVLVTQLIDDSGSIRFVQGNTEAVRNGHNLVIESLSATKQRDSILGHTRYLNGTILFDYRPLSQTVKMDSSNFNPTGGTPLYDETVVTAGTVLAKVQEFKDNGVPVRSVTLIVSDGADEHSSRNNGGRGTTARDCRAVIEDMLRSEMHIVAAMGVDDGRTDFRKVFREMGVCDEWILTPGNSPSEIRKAFLMFSQSAVRATQGAASFSQTAMGGFGNP